MARRTNAEGLIHCNACGEDYSATYKRCPFCGERMDVRPVAPLDDEDDGYVFDGQDLFDEPGDGQPSAQSRGGKRLAGHAPRGGNGGRDRAPRGRQSGPSLSRLITFIISLAVIIAALVIVFSVFYPKLHKNPNPSPSSSVSQSAQPSAEPSADPTAEPSGEPGGEPTSEPGQGPDGLTLSREDFTLRAGESYTIKAVTDPEDWTGTITWSSSDETYATVDSDGTVTNVNTDSRLHRVIITAEAGGVSRECVVYCRGSGTSPDAPDVSVSPSTDPGADPEPSSTVPAIGEGVEPGAKGVIANTGGGGVRVRSGPGTTYEILASLKEGDKITVEEDAGDGWFKISYAGKGGRETTGYIMGAYIQVTE